MVYKGGSGFIFKCTISCYACIRDTVTVTPSPTHKGHVRVTIIQSLEIKFVGETPDSALHSGAFRPNFGSGLISPY